MIIPQVFYSSRGTPLSAYHRIRDLIGRGHQVEVLTYAIGSPPPDLDIPIHRSWGPHFASKLKQGPSKVKIWFDALLFLNLIALLMRRRYDLLYAHEEGAFLAALVAPLYRIPLVYDLHSSLPLQIRDWNFSKRESVVQFFRWVEEFSLKRSRVAVAISPGVADAARSSVPGVKVVTIVNRFSLEREASAEDGRRVRSEFGLTDTDRVVLYTGSFVALQALDLLVEAVPSVVRRVPQARFLIVGGQAPEITALGALATRVGAREPIVFVPTRPQEEMPAFMAACDVLVSPRVQGINPPGKLFSYLNSGRPVVATRTLVHTQFLNDRCAILTPPTSEGIADGLVTALSDELRRNDVTRGAKEILQTEYSPAAREAAYDELLRLIATP